jgi:hypothetical protein
VTDTLTDLAVRRATCKRMTLPSEDAPPDERYSMPDPDADLEAFVRLRAAAFDPDRPHADINDIRAVLSLANGYLDLTRGEAGQEVNVKRLRDIWRERRRRGWP